MSESISVDIILLVMSDISGLVIMKESLFWYMKCEITLIGSNVIEW